MQVIKADSLVTISSLLGELGRVEAISIIYKPGEPPVAAVRVYLLLQGRSEYFLASQVALRSNDDAEIIQHMRLEPDSNFIEPNEVF